MCLKRKKETKKGGREREKEKERKREKKEKREREREERALLRGHNYNVWGEGNTPLNLLLFVSHSQRSCDK